MTVWLDGQNGNDANSGLAIDLPKKTFAAAMQALRVAALSATGDITLYIEGSGEQEYKVSATEYWTEAYNVPGRVRITAYGSGRPWLMGGTRITGFTTTPSQGVLQAAFTAKPRHVWSGVRRKMFRSNYGRELGGFTISSWDETNKAIVVADTLLPSVAARSDPDLEIVPYIGWSISRMRVASFVSLGGGLTRVNIKDPEKSVEFAKGSESNPGLGAPFGFGPFHQPGQRFYWEGARDTANIQGAWQCNGSTIQVGMPVGVSTIPQIEQEGVIAGGIETALYFFGPSRSNPVRRVTIDGMGFRNFDWQLPGSEGFIGYNGALYLRDVGGLLTFSSMPASVMGAFVDGFHIENCIFMQIGCAGISMYGWNDLHIERNAFSDIASTAIYEMADAYPAPWPPNLSPDDLPKVNVVRNNVFADIGFTYTGQAVYTGNGVDVLVTKNTMTRGADDAISCGHGALTVPTWSGRIELSHNLINSFLQETTDGAAIYVNGNQHGSTPFFAPARHKTDLHIFGNAFYFIRRTAFDPFGGHTACIYVDLGGTGWWARHNYMQDCDLAFLENCSKANRFENNRLVRVNETRLTFFSGYQVYDPERASYVQYQAPTANPATQTDIDKFYGYGDWAGRPFYEVQPFPDVPSVITASGKYNSTSVFADNGPYSAAAPLFAGADRDINQKFIRFINGRYI